jgi:subtilisin family serine protease
MLIFLVASACLAVALPVSASQAAPAGSWLPYANGERRHPKLAPLLEDQARGRRPFAANATLDGTGRVVVQVVGAPEADVEAAVLDVGGAVRTVAIGSMLAWVPPSALGALADDARVARVSVARSPTSVAMSQGVGSTGASAWQGSGLDGSGVKVGIVDIGFAQLATEQAAGRMPLTVTKQSFCNNGIDGSSAHGTAVAEIVHQMAPKAQLFLVCIQFDADLADAEKYLAQQGVSVVNASFTDNLGGRGDGSGPMGDAVTAGRQVGQLWAVAAGNEADRHLGFTAIDRDGDNVVEFVPGGSLDPAGPDNQELLGFRLPSGGTINITMKWDAWPITNQEFGVCLWTAGAPLGTFLGCQSGGQAGNPSEPIAGFFASGLAAGGYVIGVSRAPGTTITPHLDMYFDGSEQAIQRILAAGSIGEPASSPSAMAVGAHHFGNGTIESFSSQGPTIDGRIKPDIAGPDGVSNDVFNPFFGTSASSPHVAGAAALVKQALPSSTPAQLQTFLSCRAVDAGAPGPDSQFGYGRLSLGVVTNAASNAASLKPAVVQGTIVSQRSALCSGGADAVLSYGAPGDVVLLCDWDGNGTRTPGVFRNGTWLLRNAAGNGPADVAPFGLGDAGDVPVCGHWSGPGTAETAGVFRAGRFFLRFSNTTGIADANFGYGNPTDTPVTGDWDGNGTTTPGVFRNGTWFLRNSNTTGVSDQPSVGYGDPGDLPVTGDWDGNGTTTLGVFRRGVWFLRNSLGGGVADLPPFLFGTPGDRPLAWR